MRLRHETMRRRMYSARLPEAPPPKIKPKPPPMPEPPYNTFLRERQRALIEQTTPIGPRLLAALAKAPRP